MLGFVEPGGEGEGRSGRPMLRAARVLGVVVVLLIAGAFVTRAIVRAVERPDADPVHGGEVDVAGLVVPVARAVARFEDGPTVWLAAPGPEPRFDTSSLGPDRSFAPGSFDPDALEGVSGAVVYLGDLDGKPVILYAREAPLRNPWDSVYAFFMGHGDRRYVASSIGLDLGFGGSVDEDRGSAGVSTDLAWWLALPDETSVVAYERFGQPIGFQRVTGRTSLYPGTWLSGSGVAMRALDADGAELASFGAPLR
ncbi:MAG: hypothetical protein ACE5GC_10725 [Acidimicrobiia bacterium]